MLSVGIVGLPNVGKSTLFNAVASAEANVSNYPFTTIDSNVGMVPVPDDRLKALERVLKPDESTPCFIQFTDIAGLVAGASHGEGLGNQFLANIRGVDAILHVVRCFQASEVAHVLTDIDPARDIDVVETELLLADLELLDRAIEKRVRNWKTNPRQYAGEERKFRTYREKLAAGTPLRTLDLDRQTQQELKGLGLLTGKPVLYVANVSEDDYQIDHHPCEKRIEQSRIPRKPEVVVVSARIEMELQQLTAEERLEFLGAMGLARSGLERLISRAYELLDLITFYTVVNNKLRAWEIRRGTTAPVAAGTIHTDMERGFVRAQVVSSDEFILHGELQTLHRLGHVRTEGRDYEIQNGDVVEFLFSP
jgi:GTP-binding protein YchF